MENNKELELIVGGTREVKAVPFNYEELKERLLVIVRQYDNVVYSDKSISLAKEDRAYLRNIAKAFNSRRLEISKLDTKTLEEFKSKVDELMAIAIGVADKIDVQVKEYEEKERAEKQKIVDEIIKELNKVNAPYEMLFDSRF